MLVASLVSVLRLSPAEKLEYLNRLHPSDAAAITVLIDDCITHRWPKTVIELYHLAGRLEVKH